MVIPSQSTLLDLVQAVNAYAASEEEVVATVAYLINSGKVLLCGTFAGARIDLSILPSEPEALFSEAALPGGLLPLLNSRAVTAKRWQGGQLPYSIERRARAMT